MVAPANDALDRLIDPIADCLTPEVADRISRLSLDPHIAARLRAFADRATRGDLTAAEQAEHRELIELVDLVGIVQAKARRVAARRGA